MLFPVLPLSLLDVRAKHAGLFYSKSGGWYADKQYTFSRVAMSVRWHLIRMEPVEGSLNKTWAEQQSLLLPDDEVPSAAVVAFATMLHFKTTGVRLFERTYVRTSDMGADGYSVVVGYFDDNGFNVRSYWDGIRYDNLGLASSRKF